MGTITKSSFASMMFGTCGHEITERDWAFHCPMVDYDFDGSTGVSYGIYCAACRVLYAKEIRRGQRMEKKLFGKVKVALCDS